MQVNVTSYWSHSILLLLKENLTSVWVKQLLPFKLLTEGIDGKNMKYWERVEFICGEKTQNFEKSAKLPKPDRIATGDGFPHVFQKADRTKCAVMTSQHTPRAGKRRCQLGAALLWLVLTENGTIWGAAESKMMLVLFSLHLWVLGRSRSGCWFV